jgi:RNA polymerase sigma-70 factor (ECF subfamily)
MTARDRFESLYAEHAGAVRGYAMRRTSPSLADDVVAETFMVAWRRLEDVPGDPRGWLLAVAHRVLANQRRATARQHALRDRLGHEAPSPPETTPEHPGGRVLEALNHLKETDREALLLIAWEGLSHREAAQVLGVKEATFSVRFHRAKRRLARDLDVVGLQSSNVNTQPETS